LTDRDRLQDKMGKLGSGRTSAGVDARTEPALLKSIAILVDETVLPREITLSAGEVRVVLTISRRRLVKVTGDVHAHFEEDAEEPLARLRSELVGILRGKTGIGLHSERTEIPPDLQAAGPSAQALAEAWGVALYGGGGVDDLADLVRGKAYAWAAWSSGETRDEGGDPEYLKVLKKTPALKELRAQHGGARGIVAVGGNSFATAIGLAWDGESELGFVVARLDLGPIAQAFAGG